MKSCIIFGGNGFLGRNLCHALLKKKYNVSVYDRNVEKIKFLKERFPFIRVIGGDFENETDFISLLSGVDVVFYLISCTTPANKDLKIEFVNNIVPVLKLLEACSKLKKRFVFFSSGGTVYGVPKYIPIRENHSTNPISPYGIHKLTLEKCIGYYGHIYGLDYIIFRITNPYGAYQNPFSNQGVIAVFLAKAILGDEIEIWGDGSVIRDYIFVNDVMMACVAAVDYDGRERIFNISSGVGYSLSEVICEIKCQLGRKINVKYLPGRQQDVPVSILDNELAYRELSWKPKVELKDGIEYMINHWDDTSKSYLY